MKLSIKSLKIHKGMSEETLCFEATLYVNDKKACSIQNTGKGGPNRYLWIDRSAEDQINAWAEDQPLPYDFEKLDQIVGNLIDDIEHQKWLARQTRTKILFRLKGDKQDSFRSVKTQPQHRENTRQLILAKYGENLTECHG